MIVKNDLYWEFCVCEWCGSSEFTVEFNGPDRLERLPGTFQIVQCKNCGLFRQNPRLNWDSLIKFYPSEYRSYSNLYKHHVSNFKYFIHQFGNWKKKQCVNRYVDKGRVLEVGCGTGGFLELLLQTGEWHAFGIEPNEKAALFSKERLQIPIINGRFEEVELSRSSFDLIIMWYVLEHLEQPILCLQKAYNILDNGGWLFFSIPFLEGWEARLFGKYWAGWDLPRHLYIFPINMLRQILNEIGFQIVEEKCISSGHAILGHSIDFWTQEWESRHPHIKEWLMRVYLSIFGKIFTLIPLYISDKLTISTTLTIVARKK